MTLYTVKIEGYVANTLTNPFVNVFTFNVEDFGPEQLVCDELADYAFNTLLDIATGIPSIVQTTTVFERIVAECPFDGTLLAIRVVSVAGQRVGTVMPQFVAWGYKSERRRADIRAGFKRFGLVSETDTSGGVPTAGALTALNTFASVLSAPFTVEGELGMYNAISNVVKRVKYNPTPTSEAYRLPENVGEYQYYVANNWAFQQITTQNSRKR